MKTKGNTLMVILFFSLIGVFLIYKYFKEKNENKLLENSVEHFAVLIKIKGGNTHAPPSGYFRYMVDDKEYEFNDIGEYENIQIGDTFLIEYAVKDHSVARLVSK